MGGAAFEGPASAVSLAVVAGSLSTPLEPRQLLEISESGLLSLLSVQRRLLAFESPESGLSLALLGDDDDGPEQELPQFGDGQALPPFDDGDDGDDGPEQELPGDVSTGVASSDKLHVQHKQEHIAVHAYAHKQTR